jgi:hypothetical protein
MEKENNKNLCGCGRDIHYELSGGRWSCNKRVVCPTYEELREKCYKLSSLLNAYREKRKVDGLNGRPWDESKHFLAEARISELEKSIDKNE